MSSSVHGASGWDTVQPCYSEFITKCPATHVSSLLTGWVTAPEPALQPSHLHASVPCDSCCSATCRGCRTSDWNGRPHNGHALFQSPPVSECWVWEGQEHPSIAMPGPQPPCWPGMTWTHADPRQGLASPALPWPGVGPTLLLSGTRDRACPPTAGNILCPRCHLPPCHIYATFIIYSLSLN